MFNKIQAIIIGIALVLSIIFFPNPLQVFLLLFFATASRIILRPLPAIEFSTFFVVLAGSQFGVLAGIYTGIGMILLSDLWWLEFGFTVFNVIAFLFVGLLSAILPLDFILLIAVLSILYDLFSNSVSVLIYGGDIFGGILYSMAHVLANVLIAMYFKEQFLEILAMV